MRHELQCTERVSYTFKIVALSVCEVVHRISLPFAACTVMRSLYYTIHNRVAEVHVRACHVNLGTEHHLAFFYLAVVHLLKQLQAFFCRTITIRTLSSRLSRSTLLCSDFFCRLLVDICFTFFNKLNSKVPQLLEIVGSIIFVSPLVTQPLDIFLNSFNVFHVFFCRVSVVESQITYATVFLGNTEVHADGLSMSDVQITVWLWRETGLYFSSVLTFFQVFFDYLFNEVQAFLF